MPEPIQDFFRYLPVSPLDEQWGLYVIAAGSQVIPPGSDFVAKGHSREHDFLWRDGRVLREYAIVYFTRGQCEFESKETGRKMLGPGGALLLFPGIWHRYRPVKESGWDSTWVLFLGEYADRLREHGFMNPQEPVLNAGLDDRIVHGFTTLLDRVRSEPLGVQQLVAADTLQILACILSAVRQQQTSNQIQDVVRRAKLTIEASTEGLPTMEDMAEKLGLSRSYFYRVFKECTGLSPYQYNLQVQIGRARELLHGGSLSIQQIARAVNFQSPYQFCRMFKKKTGMTPSEYRHKGRKKLPTRKRR